MSKHEALVISKATRRKKRNKALTPGHLIARATENYPRALKCRRTTILCIVLRGPP